MSNRAINAIKRILPTLSMSGYKGQAGYIYVVGGSKEKAGAPYFAGMAALRVGADLASIICPDVTATAIKSFSPDLIVAPLLSTSLSNKAAVAESMAASIVKEVTGRATSLAIGPGMGRDPLISQTIVKLLSALNNKVPVVLDADALHLVADQPKVIHGRVNTILTPNYLEFARLWKAVCPKEPMPPMEMNSVFHEAEFQSMWDANGGLGGTLSADHPWARHASLLAQRLGGVTIYRKGEVDIISNGATAAYSCQPGTARRVGGQGSILAGLMAAFFGWTQSFDEKRVRQDLAFHVLAPSLLAGFAASFVMRSCALEAYRKHTRATLTSHILDEVSSVMQHHFPVPTL